MREFGRRHGVLPMLDAATRCLLESIFPLAATNAAWSWPTKRASSHAAISFPPPFVSAGIDLLTVFARSHDPGRADSIWMTFPRRSSLPVAGTAGCGGCA